LLLAASLLTIGINDGEWRNLSERGFFSVPEALVWTPWQPNDGSVTPFTHFRPEEPKPPIAEFRGGRARGILFDFTVYEGRASRGAEANFPALGPAWGASYHYVWAVVALATGAVLLAAARLSP
jgi:hypothetical protein